jgi:YD repeat-containing protein
MTEREKNGLRGPVKTCASSTTRWSYRPDGSLAEVQHRNPDGSEWTTMYVCDEAGRLSEVRSERGVLAYHYTPRGEFDRITSGERIVESWGRDERGRKTRTQHLEAPPAGAAAYQVEGSDAAFPAEGATTITTIYGDREQPLEILFHDADGRLVNRVEFVYDDAGRLIEEAWNQPFPAAMLEQVGPEQTQALRALFEGLWRRRHRYDAQGRRVETTTEFGPLGGQRTTVAYNEHGDQAEAVHFERTRELSMDGEGRLIEPDQPPEERRSEVRFEYQYDQHGNWTERVVSSRQKPDEPLLVSNSERRTIVYH